MQSLSEFDCSSLRACCFTGHRPESLPDRGNEEKRGMRELQSLLEAAVFRALESGITDFFAGGARGFDTLAAEAVLRCRETNPDVTLFLALPGRDQTEDWPEGDRPSGKQAACSRRSMPACAPGTRPARTHKPS